MRNLLHALWQPSCLALARSGRAHLPALAATVLLLFAPAGHTQAPVRSPAEYLQDFKRLVDSGDISDYKVVGEVLRMPVAPHVGEAVDSTAARGNAPIAGTSRDFWRSAPAPEYLEFPFHYGDFVPRGGGPARVLLSVYLDRTKICIKENDLAGVFPALTKTPLTDGAGVAYRTDLHSKNDITATFMIFSDTHCAERVDLTQNTQRE
jgi:hypothetical protein